jgi:TctA family transporter
MTQMARDFVASHVFRGNRNLLIVGVLVSLAGAFGLFVVQGSPWTHLLLPAATGLTGAERDGDLLQTPPTTTPEEADRQLEDVASRAPWAEVGYSAERAKEWRSRRADVLRRVDARLVA